MNGVTGKGEILPAGQLCPLDASVEYIERAALTKGIWGAQLQLGWEQHFAEIVLPAWQAYLRSEQILTEAILKEEPADRARFEVLREAGAASFYLHHYADIVAAERPDFLPKEIQHVGEVREWLARHCRMMRTDQPTADVALLGDIADALKHAHLTRRIEDRDVAARDAVIVTGSGHGQLAYGEGKYGGIDEVLILGRSRTRALTSILQNVVDAWRVVSGLPLPEFGAP